MFECFIIFFLQNKLFKINIAYRTFVLKFRKQKSFNLILAFCIMRKDLDFDSDEFGLALFFFRVSQFQARFIYIYIHIDTYVLNQVRLKAYFENFGIMCRNLFQEHACMTNHE